MDMPHFKFMENYEHLLIGVADSYVAPCSSCVSAINNLLITLVCEL